MTMLSTAKPVNYIMTRDRKTSATFYGETLGLTHLYTDHASAVFDLAGAPLRITEASDFTPRTHPVLGFEVADIEATVKELAAKGVKCTIYEGMGQDALGIWTSPDGKVKLAFFNDPDGNALTLSQHQ
ncbi:MAG: VOC family protein [Polyangiaceae bacterium]|nr:VOC family protein [Polyangiaceae bacterium]